VYFFFPSGRSRQKDTHLFVVIVEIVVVVAIIAVAAAAVVNVLSVVTTAASVVRLRLGHHL
jgi:hypothetical protein